VVPPFVQPVFGTFHFYPKCRLFVRFAKYAVSSPLPHFFQFSQFPAASLRNVPQTRINKNPKTIFNPGISTLPHFPTAARTTRMGKLKTK
jgi:hypothetical protein